MRNLAPRAREPVARSPLGGIYSPTHRIPITFLAKEDPDTDAFPDDSGKQARFLNVHPYVTVRSNFVSPL